MSNDYSNIKVLTLGDISFISPYINANYALHCVVNPLLIALYKILRMLENFIVSKVPFHRLPYLKYYIAAREIDPRLKNIEQFILWIVLSLAGARAHFISSNNLSPASLGEFPDYDDFTKEFSIYDSTCEEKLSSIYSILTNKHITDESKVTVLELFIKYLYKTSNTGQRQTLILCLVSLCSQYTPCLRSFR